MSFRFDINSPPGQALLKKSKGSGDSVPSTGALSEYSDESTPRSDEDISLMAEDVASVSKQLFQSPPPQFQSRWDQVVSTIRPTIPANLRSPSPAKSDIAAHYLDLAVPTVREEDVLDTSDTPRVKNVSPKEANVMDGPWLAPNCTTVSSAAQWADVMAILHPNAGEKTAKPRSLWPSRVSPQATILGNLDNETEDDDTVVTTNIDDSGKDMTIFDYRAKVAKLSREIVALKSILDEDAKKIMSVKSSMEKLKESNRNYLYQIDVYTSDLRDAKHQVEELEREVEDQKDCKEQNRKIILQLQEEVDRLNKEQREVAAKKKTRTDELSKLRFENEMFATELVHNNEQLDELKKKLEEAMAENTKLKVAISGNEKAALLDQLSKKSKSESPLQVEGNTSFDVQSRIEELTLKLDEVEKERSALSIAHQEDLQRKNGELSEIKAIVQDILRKQDENVKQHVSVEPQPVSSPVRNLVPEIGSDEGGTYETRPLQELGGSKVLLVKSSEFGKSKTPTTPTNSKSKAKPPTNSCNPFSICLGD